MTSLASTFTRPRKKFQKVKSAAEIPYLIEVQKKSYEKFLQKDLAPDKREDYGLQGAFRSVFPIVDFTGTASVEFVSYGFEEPKYSVVECRQRGMSFAAPLKVVIRLVVWDVDKDTEVKSIRDVKEQEIYFGEIPLMTADGTFVINGAERVIVSQLHRSSGVFFDHDKGKSSTTGKVLYTARVIPYRGSWLDFEFDAKDILHVRIDRRRKFPATILLKALGYSAKELLDMFHTPETVKLEKGKILRVLDFQTIRGQRASSNIFDPKTKKLIVKRGRRITAGIVRQIQKAGIEYIELVPEGLQGMIAAEPIQDKKGVEVVPYNTEMDADSIQAIQDAGISQFQVYFIDGVNVDGSIRETLLSDKVESVDDAVLEIYKRMRPGDPPNLDAAQAYFDNLFFDPDRYDLSAVGRIKLNERLGLTIPLETKTLTKEDIVKTVSYLVDLKNDKGVTDDIDHLGNRRVRAVGELLENQYRIGLLRIEKAIRERLQLQDVDTLLPHDFVNNKPASAVVKEFFGSSQLSQFMDQTNPLSEITHKRRLSALGPGGLNRERAGFEVRDVHPTHYGRICPIETPEGPNIGLISSLASFGRVNEYGFIETPYRAVVGEKKGDVKYYSASEEHNEHVIGQPTFSDDINPDDLIFTRRRGETEIVRAEECDLADVATNQLVSVAASLIPFLQNDDANRALMGSNMQRQAVPLLRSEAPLVGTGMERIVARDSGATVVAQRSGTVVYVDAERVIVKTDEDSPDTEIGADVDIYELQKFKRSNVDTAINQKPIVVEGETVNKGDIIVDGFATEMGELALGQNVVVAFMPWHGYNFEDSILLSERLAKEDRFTSVHIQEFECISRDTKLGQEEITADIPNVGEDALAQLDEAGVISVGAEVSPGDILVGKITPKGETQLTPEEKLLRAIFGEKAGDVRDSSLRVPPGVVGTVIGAKVFAREGTLKDIRNLQIEEEDIARIRQNERDQIKIIKESAARKIESLCKNAKVTKDVGNKDGETIVAKGDKVDAGSLMKLDYSNWFQISVDQVKANDSVLTLLENLRQKINVIRFRTEEEIKKVKKGDELPPGVIKMVKVYVAIKRKIQVGDKMAGRHGNKGVVSRILPEEDMPFLANGRPVDVVLNPLGVPSRMNVGQILETHLGWGAKGMGERIQDMLDTKRNRKEVEGFIKEIWADDDEVLEFASKANDEDLTKFAAKYVKGIPLTNPVFDGADEEDIRWSLRLAGFDEGGQTELYDGLTGEKFDNRVTVGIMYVLKLHHLVDEKIHARSIGPYSLVTQQPLGGKAQFGGQRLGEMEVWAMEAYGAANALQEFLTVKSDDVTGRTRMYESIVKGSNLISPGLPESFNVLVKELQSLGLDVSLIKGDQEVDSDQLTRENA